MTSRTSATSPLLSVEQLQEAIRLLTMKDLIALRQWILEYEEDAWDEEIERDILAGKFDALAEEARREYLNGETLPL